MRPGRIKKIEFVARFVKEQTSIKDQQLKLVEQSTFSKQFKSQVIKRIQDGTTTSDIRSQQE